MLGLSQFLEESDENVMFCFSKSFLFYNLLSRGLSYAAYYIVATMFISVLCFAGSLLFGTLIKHHYTSEDQDQVICNWDSLH